MEESSHVALCNCYFCGEPNEIAIATRYQLNGKPVTDMSKLHGKVISMEPCSKCRDYMKQGIILIGIDPEKSEPDWYRRPANLAEGKSWIPNPHRTGQFIVLKEEAFSRAFVGEPAAQGLKNRWTFVDVVVLEALGLCKEGK